MAKRRRIPFQPKWRSITLGLCIFCIQAPFAAAEIIRDGTVGPACIGSACAIGNSPYVITDNLGARAGNNLFHSFGTFNVGTNESATFTNSGAPLVNVIARVTGGASSIDGLLSSTITGPGGTGTNLFLLNPAGIMFGPNAHLEITGSFYASTADYLKFANGGEIFSANPASTSVLSTEEPAAFGFLGTHPVSAITVDRAVLQVPEGKVLSLIGGNVLLTNLLSNDPPPPSYFDFDQLSPTYGAGPNYYLLSAPGGRINLVSTASSGEVNLNTANLGVGSFSSLGTITLEKGANLNVATDAAASGPGGTIFIRGGQITVSGSGIVGLASGMEASGAPPGVIDIGGGSLHIDNSLIAAYNTGETDRPSDAAAAIRLGLTGYLSLTSGSMFESSTFWLGRAGNISISAASTALADASRIESSTYAPGNAGNVTISAPTISLVGGSSIMSSTYYDVGNAGNITLAAATSVTLNGQSVIDSSTYTAGQAGNISISAPDITVTGSSKIQSLNVDTGVGVGRAGDIAMNATRFTLADHSIIESTTSTSEPAGTITIAVVEASLNGASVIRSNSQGAGRAGDISINGSTGISLTDSSSIISYANDAGRAGDIFLAAGTVSLNNASQVQSLSTLTGDAGNIAITATKNMGVTLASAIETSTTGSGHAGNINITADSVTLGDTNQGVGPYVADGYYGTIRSATTGSGPGGNISLTTLGQLQVQNGFAVYATSGGQGNAGNITIQADTLQCLNNGDIGTNVSGTGNGGLVTVTARDILFSAKDREAVLNQNHITGISAQVSGNSQGGKIIVTTDRLRILDGGQISTILSSNGNGSDIEVNAKNITISGYAVVNSPTPTPFYSSIDARVNSATATGTGGNITVTATETLSLDNTGNIRSSLSNDSPGKAGNITVQAGTIDIASLGRIYADSFRGTGDSGNIQITAQQLSISGTNGAPQPAMLDNDFTGLSTTTNSGAGGNINVNLTGNLTLAATGGIKADTQGKGLGGSVILSAANVALSSGASINSASSSTDTENLAGNAGNISITAANSVLLRDAAITSEAARSNGGEITIAAPNRISLVNSVITAKVQGDAMTVGGKIFIDPQFVVLKNSTVDATAVDGTGGTIRLVADTFLADPQSSVIAFSERGINGTVDIQAPIANVSGLLSPLSSDYVSASALLRERCIARIREGGSYSSFVVGGRDGLPMEPGSILPSLMY